MKSVMQTKRSSAHRCLMLRIRQWCRQWSRSVELTILLQQSERRAARRGSSCQLWAAILEILRTRCWSYNTSHHCSSSFLIPVSLPVTTPPPPLPLSFPAQCYHSPAFKTQHSIIRGYYNITIYNTLLLVRGYYVHPSVSSTLSKLFELSCIKYLSVMRVWSSYHDSSPVSSRYMLIWWESKVVRLPRQCTPSPSPHYYSQRLQQCNN